MRGLGRRISPRAYLTTGNRSSSLQVALARSDADPHAGRVERASGNVGVSTRKFPARRGIVDAPWRIDASPSSNVHVRPEEFPCRQRQVAAPAGKSGPVCGIDAPWGVKFPVPRGTSRIAGRGCRQRA